jgi:hypothetical protein
MRAKWRNIFKRDPFIFTKANQTLEYSYKSRGRPQIFIGQIKKSYFIGDVTLYSLDSSKSIKGNLTLPKRRDWSPKSNMRFEAVKLS